MKDNLMVSALDHCKTQMNAGVPAGRSLRTFTAGLTAMALSLLGTTQAMAATQDVVKKGPLAPSCVVSSGSGRTVVVTNRCSTTQRVKVVFAFAPDGGCTTYSPGRSIRWTSPVLTARFDRLESC
jgi:hypothetical protein